MNFHKLLLIALLLALAVHRPLRAQDSTSATIVSGTNLFGRQGSSQPFYFSLTGDHHTLSFTASITQPGNVDFIITTANDTNYSNLPYSYVGQSGSRIFPDVTAGNYKVVVFGKTNFSGFNFTLNEILSPPHVVLFLHGFQGQPSSWDTFVSKLIRKKKTDVVAPVVFNGQIQDNAVATKIPGHYQTPDNVALNCNYFLYRIAFGALDTVSGRLSVRGKPAKMPMSGDFETFDSLGLEVKQAIAAILLRHPNAQIVLMAHSRGGLAARAFLQGPNFTEKAAVVGLVTLGTPHHGSYFGRLGPYLATHPESTDPDTWRIVRGLKFFGFVDAFRPTVGDLATGGPAMNALNAGVGSLPTRVRYYNYVYIGRPFGEFPHDAGNIFRGTDSVIGHVSNAAKDAMTGTVPFSQLIGDGIVDQAAQRMDNLPGLPPGIDIQYIFQPSGIFHTEEHDQSLDILASLETVKGWKILP